jgi:hypothetical protein
MSFVDALTASHIGREFLSADEKRSRDSGHREHGREDTDLRGSPWRSLFLLHAACQLFFVVWAMNGE